MEYEITNTGAYYCEYFYVNISKSNQPGLKAVDYTVDDLFNQINVYILGDPALGPGATKHFFCNVQNKRPEEIKDNVKVRCKAYTAVAETFVLNDAGFSFVEETTDPDSKYPYIYKANFDYSYSSKENNNCLCFTLSYQGKDYYFASHHFYKNSASLSEIELQTKEELNLDEVSISNVMVVKARSRGGGGAILLIPILLGFIILIAMGIALIVGIVIIVVSIVKSRKQQKLTMSDINK